MDIALLAKLYEQHVADLSRRYAEVLASSGFDAVVLHSGSANLRTIYDDQYWPLRPTPHFQHWLPLTQPDCALIVAQGAKPKLVWPKWTSIWEQPPTPESDHFTRVLEIERPGSVDAAKELFAPLLQKGKVAYVSEDAARAAAWGLDAHVNPPDLVGPLDRLRTVKTPYEAACLDEANRLAALGHAAVQKAFLDGDRSELDLHLLFLAATGQDDPETPYKNIVALGEHAAVLHHVAYGKRPTVRTGESLLLDAGATYLGYCSDITRTWVKGSGATLSTFTALVDGVEAMQKRLCDAVKLGNGYEKLHEDSHRQVAEILREVGISKLSAEETLAKGITRAFYPHGLGHSLGLQCHDVGCALIKPKPENPYLRNTSTISPHQTFTIEPGIYFIEGLLAELRQGANAAAIDFTLVDALTPLGGVRIEDDLLVLEPNEANQAVKNLTRAYLPRGGGRSATASA